MSSSTETHLTLILFGMLLPLSRNFTGSRKLGLDTWDNYP